MNIRVEKTLKALAKVLDEWDNIPNDIKSIDELDKFSVLMNYLEGIVDSEDEEDE